VLTSPTPDAYLLYHPFRTVEPPDSPLSGTLARGPGGRTVLLVDRDAVDDWPGWGADGEPHLLSPLDVVRRADGHDVVLPALGESAGGFLMRRRDAQAPLSTGEAITLAVSVIRGLTASVSRAPEVAGEWWLGDDGRPVLVEGVGDTTARRASAEVLTSVADELPRTRIGAVLGQLATACADPAFGRDASEWEERLFALGEAEPLVTDVLGPRRARSVSAVPAATVIPESGRRPWWARLAASVDGDLAQAASDALTRLARKARGARASRGRPVMWAAGIGLAVIVGGLLWPASTDAPTAAEVQTSPAATPSVPSPPVAAEPSASRSPEDGASDLVASTGDDPATATGALLDKRRSCTDAACAASVLEDPARTLPAGVVDAPNGARSVTLLDDLGGLAVLRVDANDGSMPMQLVTVVETAQGWRIRDVHDVEDAPS
jgi:hypothetical protein